MGADLDIEKERRNHRQACPDEIGCIQRADLSDVTAEQQPGSDTHVPRREVGGCRCTALAVGCEIHEQRIEGREHRSESYPEQERDAEEDVPSDCGELRHQPFA